MADIQKITEREQVPEEHRHHYDDVLASRGSIGAPYYYLLHSPDLAGRTAHLVGYARFESILPEQIKELAICAVAREMDCLYEWAAHEGDAIAAGASPEAVSAVRNNQDLHDIAEEEAVVVSFIRELLRPPHRVSSNTFQRIHDLLGDALLADMSGVIGAYVGLACSLNAFDIPTPPGRPILPT